MPECTMPHWQSLPRLIPFSWTSRARTSNPSMPTRNINLTPAQDAFVDKVVGAGEYQNASEAVRDALRALQQRRREDALKLKALRQQIDAGIAALEHGEFTEVADAELNAYLETLADRPSNRAR